MGVFVFVEGYWVFVGWDFYWYYFVVEVFVFDGGGGVFL